MVQRQQATNHFSIFFPVFLLLFCCKSGSAQIGSSLEAQDTLPFDSEIHTGKLSNGLTYYIRANAEPKSRVHMRLVVKAGREHEDDDQIELAHMLEHLAFSSSIHFGNAFEYFGRRGIQAEDGLKGVLNGYVGGDRTLYKIECPANDKKLMQDALLFLSDCAHGILLTPDKIDAERFVILSELNRNATANSIRHYYLSHLIGNETYAQRQRADKQECIKSFTHEALDRFYREWYRPDLQAIIIVGDVVPGEVEAQLKRMFQWKDSVGTHPIRRQVPSDFKRTQSFTALVHPGHSRLEIKAFMRHPERRHLTKEDLEYSIKARLYNLLIKPRIERLKDQYNPPFEWARSVFEEELPVLASQFGVLCTSIRIETDAIKYGFQSVMTELFRVKEYGFSQKELDDAKQELSRNYGPSIIISSQIANDLTEHFVNGAAVPGADHKQKAISRIIDELTVTEVNETVRRWIDFENIDLVVLSPPVGIRKMPERKEFMQWLEEIKTAPIVQNDYDSEPGAFMTDDQVLAIGEGGILKRFISRKAKVIQLQLANGVNVLLKPLDDKLQPGRVNLLGYCPGGLSSYSGVDSLMACHAPEILSKSGLGNFGPFELRRYTRTHELKVFPYITAEAVGLRGSSGSENFEKVLQLVHEYLANPRKDEVAYQHYLTRFKSQKISRHIDPVQVFYDSIQTLLNLSDVSRRYSTKELDMFNLNQVYQIYKASFGRMQDFTFVITGAFEPDSMATMVAKYLGTISPVAHKTRSESPQSHSSVVNKPQFNKSIHIGALKESSIVHLRFRGRCHIDMRTRVTLNYLADVLKRILTDRLRLMEAGTYSVGVGATMRRSKMATGVYDLMIEFSCAPEHAAQMILSVTNEIDHLKMNGLDSLTFMTAVGSQMEKYSNDIRRNEFWQSYLIDQISNGRDIDEVTLVPKFLAQTTPKSVIKAARIFLNDRRYHQFVMFPSNQNDPD